MEKIMVVGAGVMGKGIAYACAISGYQVYLNDINQEVLEKAKKEIYILMERSFLKGFLTKEQLEQSKENLSIEKDLEKAGREVDLVIEAVLRKNGH